MFDNIWMYWLSPEKFADGDGCGNAHIQRLAAGCLGLGDEQALVHMLGNFGADALAFIAE